jgi:hypothetical protein
MTTLTSAAPLLKRNRVYQRPVPPEWDAALAEAYPRDRDMEAWPILVWEPGYDYVIEGNTVDEIVERWMLYNMIDIRCFDPNDPVHGAWNRGLLAELNGPPPESLRQTIPLPEAPIPNTVRIISGTGVVNQRQWELYRQTGRYGVPIWCVQGDKGGTPMNYPPLFVARAKLKGLPLEPPLPGTLPYADFSALTLKALDQFVRIKERDLNIGENKKRTGILNQEEARACVKLVDALLEENVAATADYVAWATKDWDVPIVDRDPAKDLEALNARQDADHAARLAAL